MKDINEIIRNTDAHNVNDINWTNAWSKKYPVLACYQKEVNIKNILVKAC